jgi:hypothetical protein
VQARLTLDMSENNGLTRQAWPGFATLAGCRHPRQVLATFEARQRGLEPGKPWGAILIKHSGGKLEAQTTVFLSQRRLVRAVRPVTSLLVRQTM